MAEIIGHDNVISNDVNITPTVYRISTITCNGTVGCGINLDLLYRHTRIAVNGEPSGFVWAEFGTFNNRGTYPKKRKTSMTNRKSFDNQVTVIYKVHNGYAPNIKVFRNGNIQMTGIRTPDDGIMMINMIAKEVEYIAKELDPTIAKVEDISPGDFKIRMINSDFSFDFKIRRKDLHMLLISNTYNTISSFQPGTYPGVKIQYFWNERSINKSGHCECLRPCHGRGENAVVGTEPYDGQCKKVTISVFESGKILITGATSYAQIDEAYAYIVKVIQDNIVRIKKNAIQSA